MCFILKGQLSWHVQQCIQCLPVENKLVLFLCLLLPVPAEVRCFTQTCFFLLFFVVIVVLGSRSLHSPKCAVCVNLCYYE